MTEEWRDIPGLENRYQASSQGRIRSLDRTLESRKGRFWVHKGRILSPRPDKRGYLTFQDGRRKTWKVHRAVALAFCVNSDQKILIDVNHINSIKLDNTYTNLEWCTKDQNRKHGIDYYRKVGLPKTYYAVHNPRKARRATLEIVSNIHKLHASGLSQRAIGRQFDLHGGTIGRILRGEIWKDANAST